MTPAHVYEISASRRDNGERPDWVLDSILLLSASILMLELVFDEPPYPYPSPILSLDAR
jgi:hypothetical protein